MSVSQGQPALVQELSFGYWFLVHFLLSIPVLGFILCVIWAVGGKPSPGKECLVNFSRARLLWSLVSGLFTVLLWCLLWVAVSVGISS